MAETRVTVYTAIYGWYDVLKRQLQQTIDVNFVCFSDWKDFLAEAGAAQQRDIKLQPVDKTKQRKESVKGHEWQANHSRMQAKYIRMHPFEFFPNNEFVIYIDWSARLLSNNSIEFFVSHFDPDADIMMRKHPVRDCIYDEAKASMEHLKYKTQDINGQIRHYKDELKHPPHAGLSASGLMVIRNNEKVRKFLHAWRTENLRWTYQDQLSFEPLARIMGIKRQRIDPIYGNLRHNKLIDFLNPHVFPNL